MMFSATFSEECQKLAKDYLCSDYVCIRVGRAGSTHQNIQQQARLDFCRYLSMRLLIPGWLIR